MPRPTQNQLKQHDRKYTDIQTLIGQRRLLRGTVLRYQQQIEKSVQSYEDWCKKNEIKPEKINIPSLADDKLI